MHAAPKSFQAWNFSIISTATKSHSSQQLYVTTRFISDLVWWQWQNERVTSHFYGVGVPEENLHKYYDFNLWLGVDIK